MSTSPAYHHTAFVGHQILATGPLAEVALAVKRAQAAAAQAAVLVFHDATGRQIDLDLSGTEQQVLNRHTPFAPTEDPAAPSSPSPTVARGRGRPKLGVVAREVTLLPRHWEWLSTQSGGASVALRKLVEQARRAHEAQDARRARQEAAYHFMGSLAGNLPGFEEATRALYANDLLRFSQQVAAWPAAVRDYAMRLAWQDASAPLDESK